MNNNNNQSHDELPNIGLSNQQLLSSLNANSAAAGNGTNNLSSTSSAVANTNNNSHTTNNLSSNLTNNPNNTTNNQQGILNIPLSQLPSPTLCASCDKCRQRKTKCDGGRPCLNCITRYRKMKKLDASASLEGIDYSQFDCIYSPAKRRGPVPGKTSKGSSRVPSNYPMGITSASQYNALQNNQFGGMNNINNMGTLLNPQIQQLTQAINNGTFTSDELKQMLALQQQLLISQQNSMMAQQSNNMGTVGGAQGVLLNNMLQQHQQQNQQGMGLGGGLNGVGMNNNGMGNINNNMSNLQNTTSNQTTIPGLMDANGNIDMNVLQSLTDQQLGIQMQLQQQQQQQMPDNNNLMSMNNNQQQQFMIPNNQMSMSPQLGMTMDQQNGGGVDQNGPSAKRVHTNGDVISTPDPSTIDGLPPSVVKHLPLLQLNNSNGALLRSYYELSTNDILHLLRIPTDSEYCTLLNQTQQNNGTQTVYNIPTYDQSALYAARFSEVALGALANNQLSLGLELSNASVMCLRNCCFVDDENQQGHNVSSMYNVARAYLLHGIFRSFRGDMVRYFKYRRVCMTLIQQMDNEPQVDALLAAISFHDAWTYMMHNASEDALPEIDGAIPKLNNNDGSSCPARTANEVVMTKYGCDTHPSSVAADPDNQMWMQGPPPVFLNNEAHLISRSLDAFACAIRSCCDQANTSFEGMAKASGVDILGNGKGNVDTGNDASSTSAIPTTVAIPTPTTTAVMANENELCSRNIVMSAKTLLDQHWAVAGDSSPKRHGLDMMVHALSAFLEKDPPDPSKQEQLSSSSVDGSEEGGGGASESGGGEEEGFSESQIQNLLAACDIIIQHPLLLHCPGPIYHMSSNAAIMLCHLLNGIHAKCDAATNKRSKDDGTSPPPPGDDDAEIMNGMSMLFDQVLDTFMSMRKILNLHRQNLPPKLRCHGIPRPSGIGPFNKSSNESSKEDTQQQKPFIELGDTLMCLCRGCQGFVLMGCSPCVAAERTMKTALDHALDTNNGEVTDPLRVEGDIGPLEDMALDDDYLLDILSKFNN